MGLINCYADAESGRGSPPGEVEEVFPQYYLFFRITNCERIAGGQWKVTQELGGSGTGCCRHVLFIFYIVDIVIIMHYHGERKNLSNIQE